MSEEQSQRNSLGQFAPGNTPTGGKHGYQHPGNTKHTGEKSVVALTKGTPLVGIALELQADVHAEIELQGILAVMRERAERHQAVADLFYGLIVGCDDNERIDNFVRRFGWLNSKAFAMLREIRDVEATGTGDIIDAALQASAPKADNGEN